MQPITGSGSIEEGLFNYMLDRPFTPTNDNLTKGCFIFL